MVNASDHAADASRARSRGAGRADHYEKTRVSSSSASPARRSTTRSSRAKDPNARAYGVRRVHDGLPRGFQEHSTKLPLSGREARLRDPGPRPRCSPSGRSREVAIASRRSVHRRRRSSRVLRRSSRLLRRGPGTIPLLLKMKEDPEGFRLSDRLGPQHQQRVDHQRGERGRRGGLPKGIAISFILHTDDHSHFEPVRYGPAHFPALLFLMRLKERRFEDRLHRNRPEAL